MEDAQKTISPVLEAPSEFGVLHWTGVKLHGWLKEHRGLDISYRTTLRYLHDLDFRRLFPRPVPAPPDTDKWEQARDAFAPKLFALLDDPAAHVFFSDEAGFEGDPRPRQRWVKRGSKPVSGYAGGHLRTNVVGAISPESGQLVSLVVPFCNTAVFQMFLDTFAREVPFEPGRKTYLVLDNASWHKSASLQWHHIEPVYLPPYSPDMNVIERLWAYLKSHGMAGFFTSDANDLDEKLCEEIKLLLEDRKTLKSVCSKNIG